MRKLITLVESALAEASWDDDEDEDFDDERYDDEEEEDEGPEIETTGYKFGTLPYFYRQVVAVADQHMDMGDEIEISDVKDWIEHHRELFQPGTITVYRTMMLNPSFVENLTPGTELGQHWTYEFDGSVIDDFDINGDKEHASKGKAELFVFEGEIETRDANLPLTVAYNCLFPHEKEIFLTGDVTLKSITEYDPYDGHKEKVRPDLTGKRFGV